MAVWNGTVTTQLGLNLIAKVIAGKTLVSFTGFKTSDGNFNGVDLKNMVVLPSIKQEFGVSNISIQNPTTVLVKGVITNTGLSNQYPLNAVGLYATDPEIGEILFSVTTADVADVIPAKTNTNTTSLILNVLTSVTDANKVTLSLSQPAIATTDMLEVYIKGTDLATDTIAGIAKIATQPEVDTGVEDTKIVTSKKLKARLDTLLTSIDTNFVKLTQLATESIAGTIKISSTAQVIAGTDNTTVVSPYKLKEIFVNGSTKTQNGYQKFPGGLIVQWGMVADNGNAAISVTFPVAFPTSCASLQITRGGGLGPTGSYESGASVIISMSNSGFMLDSVARSSDKSLVYYVAIGY